MDEFKRPKFGETTEINLDAFFSDAEYRDLTINGAFQKLERDMQGVSKREFGVDAPPMDMMPEQIKTFFKEGFKLGYPDAVASGVAGVKSRMKKIIEHHLFIMKGNKAFADMMLEIINLTSKDGAMFMDGEQLETFKRNIKDFGKEGETQSKKISEIIEN